MPATPQIDHGSSVLGRAGIPAWVPLAHEAAAVGAAVIGRDGRLLWVNRAMLELVHRAEADLLGQSAISLVNRADSTALREAVTQVSAGSIATMRLHGHAPGSWLHVSLSVLKSEAGDEVGVLAQAIDVTTAVQDQVSLEVLSNNVLDAVAVIDDAGVITWASPSVWTALGPDADPEAIIGRQITSLIAHEDLNGFADALAGAGPELDPITRTVRFRSASSADRYMSVTARPVANSGTGHRIAIAMRDVTEELRAKRELARSEELFRMAMLGAPEGMAVTDSQDRIVEVNPALCDLLGAAGPALLGHRFREYIPAEEREGVDRWRDRLLRGNSPVERYQHRLTSRNREVWVDHSVGIMRDELGNPALFVHQFADRTAARRQEADLTYRASHDAHTGLANKESLRTRLAQRLGLPKESTDTVGVLFCDIDNLKPINDRYGHLAGDAVISAVASRLRGAVRRQDEVARYGGDEFFIVLDHCASVEELAVVARNVQRAVSLPIESAGASIDVSISVGAVLAEATAETDDALRRADEALYQAKRSGGNRICVEGLSEV